MKTAAVVMLALIVLMAPISAQWTTPPSAGLPRTREGRVDLTAKTPKARDRKPDLSGVWLAEPNPDGKREGVENEINPRFFVNVADGLDLLGDHLQPSAAALFKERLAGDGKDDPITSCQPSGIPALNSFPTPLKIVQTPSLIVVLYEENTTFRQLFLDGRALPQDPQPSWMGYSVGKWNADTLVVESAGFNERSWLDRMGHPHSEALRVVERFRRKDLGHLDIEITIDDPKTYTRPLTYTQHLRLLPDGDLIEYYCTENEKDRSHFK